MEDGVGDARPGDEAHLADVMAEAARALNEPETMEEVLDRLVRAACTAIPGVDFAGVSIARRSGIQTMAVTDPLVEKADAAQYELGEGPCLDAIAGNTVMLVTDMRTERRWPQFAPQAVALGVLSQMGVEIFRDGSTAGGLNLYATRPHAFDDSTRHAATLFAVHAAVALNKVMTVTGLTEALQTRQHIGEAVGIIMERYTIDEHAAFRYLVRISQNSNIPLREVARTLASQSGTSSAGPRHPTAPVGHRPSPRPPQQL